MKDISYKVINLTDKEGMPKEGVLDFSGKSFNLFRVQVGSSAILDVVGSNGSIATSTVKAIHVFNDVVEIHTRNSIYHLQAYTEKKGS